MQFHYNAAFKCLKSTTKTLGKDVKYVQGRIIQGKISWGNFMGGDFQVGGNCPEGNYLGVIAQEVVVLWKLHRGQLSKRQLSRGNYSGVIVLVGFHKGNCQGAVVQGEII